jgi:hypothetical protein
MLLFIRERFSLYFFESNLFVVIIYRARVEMLFATFIFFSPHRQANSFLISSDRSQLPAVDPHHIHIKEGCARGFIIRETFLYSFLALKPKR